jgi:GNAT superfamily N-acetyltransferase
MEHSKILYATSPEDIDRVYPVMRELRPHLTSDQFRIQVLRQQCHEFQLTYLEHASEVRAAAGFRITERLSWGKILHVDDLVTRSEDHGKGFGSRLFDWLVDQARANGCAQFHLDSGVQRFAAHRFYLGKGMDITCHHFGLKL